MPPERCSIVTAGMDSLESLIQAARESRAPVGVATRLIAIDGPGGAGKTTLAARLAEELQAAVIHTDEFASWDNPINWWPEMLERALKPLAAGESAHYQPTAWGGGEERARVVIEPGGTVVLEGVTASRRVFRPYIAYSIWIETARALRLQRGIDRDGEDARVQWERWMADEDRYIESERPYEHVDVVLRGDRDLRR
jgi:uridine kinase